MIEEASGSHWIFILASLASASSTPTTKKNDQHCYHYYHHEGYDYNYNYNYGASTIFYYELCSAPLLGCYNCCCWVSTLTLARSRQGSLLGLGFRV